MKAAKRFYFGEDIPLNRYKRLKRRLQLNTIQQGYYVIYYTEAHFILQMATIEELKKTRKYQKSVVAVGITETEEEGYTVIQRIVEELYKEGKGLKDRDFFTSSPEDEGGI